MKKLQKGMLIEIEAYKTINGMKVFQLYKIEDIEIPTKTDSYWKFTASRFNSKTGDTVSYLIPMKVDEDRIRIISGVGKL